MAMRFLLSLLTASDRVAVSETNFERLDEAVFFYSPTRIGGVPNALIGPITSGDHVVKELFVDSLLALWLCTVSGTPGTWVQVRPAPASAFPGGAPDGYVVSRTDQHGKLYYYNAGGAIWVEIFPTAAGGGANQNVGFSSEDPMISASYIGGRFRWQNDAALISGSIVCEAPVGAGISFTLEINGVLTAKVLTVAAGATNAEIDLTGVTVPAGQYARWKCTASPSIDNTASQIHITMNLTV